MNSCPLCWTLFNRGDILFFFNWGKKVNLLWNEEISEENVSLVTNVTIFGFTGDIHTTKWETWITALLMQISCWHRMWKGSVTVWWIFTPTSARYKTPLSKIPILLSQYISWHLLSSSCFSPSSPCWISVYTFSNWQQQSVLRWECTTLCKSTVDWCLWTFWGSFGLFVQGPATMMAYLLISGLFLTRLRRPIGKMTVTEQKYEGEYRYVNSRLITNRWLVVLVSIFVL